jgi:molecular chaperone DnaJ
MGGRGRGRQRGPTPGRDIEGRIRLDLEEAFHGAEKEVTLRRPEQCPDCGGEGHPEDAEARTCPNCDGQGQVRQVQQTPLGRVQQTTTCERCSGTGETYSETCSTCGGEGRVTREATVAVDIPQGISDGQAIRIRGEGEPGEPGAEDGDLVVEVRVNDHEEFERDGDDLHTTTAVSFPQAVFGDTVEVETIDGTVEFEVDAGTQSGEQFRLRGKGMPRFRGSGRGDLYVEVHVVTPQSLNEDQREALEAFAEAGGEEVDVDQGFIDRIRSSL